MKILKFRVDNQELTRLSNETIVASSENYLIAEFEFSSEWNAFDKVIKFGSPNNNIICTIKDNRVKIPDSIIQYPGFYFSVEGENEETHSRITSTLLTIEVEKGFEKVGDWTNPPVKYIEGPDIDVEKIGDSVKIELNGNVPKRLNYDVETDKLQLINTEGDVISEVNMFMSYIRKQSKEMILSLWVGELETLEEVAEDFANSDRFHEVFNASFLDITYSDSQRAHNLYWKTHEVSSDDYMRADFTDGYKVITFTCNYNEDDYSDHNHVMIKSTSEHQNAFDELQNKLDESISEQEERNVNYDEAYDFVAEHYNSHRRYLKGINIRNPDDDTEVSAGSAPLRLKGNRIEANVDGGPLAVHADDFTFNGDDVATQNYVRSAIEEIVANAPEALNTLKELADAIASNKEVATALQQLVNSHVTASNTAHQTLEQKIAEVKELLSSIAKWNPEYSSDDMKEPKIEMHSQDSVFELTNRLFKLFLWSANFEVDVTSESEGTDGKVEFSALRYIINTFKHFVINELYAGELFRVSSNEFKYKQKDVALKEDIDNAIRSLINNAPEALNTLKELADAIASNKDVATAVEQLVNSHISASNAAHQTLTNGLATKANSSDVYTKTEIDKKIDDAKEEAKLLSTFDKSSFVQLKKIVSRQGINLEDILEVGDSFATTYKHYTSATGYTEYPSAYNIVELERSANFKDGQGVFSTPAVVLEMDSLVPHYVPFSPSQAVVTLSNGLPVGSYCFYVTDAGWNNSTAFNNKYLCFILTQPIPAKGQIRCDCGDKTTWTIKTYTACDGDAIETSVSTTPSATKVGTYLGKTNGSVTATDEVVASLTIDGTVYPIGKLNHIGRIAYGSNRWATSCARRWLNSRAEYGKWWQPCEVFYGTNPQTGQPNLIDPYEVKPATDFLNRAGFLRSMAKSMYDSLPYCEVKTLVPNCDRNIAMYEAGTSRAHDITYDKVFLLSETEANRNTNNFRVDKEIEGEPYEFYKQLASEVQEERPDLIDIIDGQPIFKLYKDNPWLKMYGLENKASSHNYWSRGANRSHANSVWGAYYTGSLRSYGANYTDFRLAPACKIGGNRA